MSTALTLQQKRERAMNAKTAVTSTATESSTETPTIVRKEMDRATRKSRAPFGSTRLKLEVTGNIPGYHLHWVNDSPGRIAQAEEGGYQFVEKGELSMSYNNVTSRDKDLGSRMQVLVGTNEDGSPLYAYLMKLQQDWYEEDQQAGQSQIDTVDASIRGGTVEKVTNKYIPSGMSIKSM